jgi:putative aminophosphonate oxidoreductase
MAAPSYWYEQALAATPIAASTRLSGRVTADVCIVGGGFLGLWTAIRLKEGEPKLDVVVVEQRLCGTGASGRNGGFVTTYWAKFPSLAKIKGRDAAAWVARESERAVIGLGAFCREHGVEAEYRRDGWLWTATNDAQVGAWDPVIESLAETNERPFERLDAGDVARISGSDRNLAGVIEKHAATVQPAKLALGLRAVALSKGVRIFEDSPMTRLIRSRPPVVETEGGSVAAGKVVLAMNAWSARFPEFRRAVIVVSSDVVATAARPEALKRIGLTNGAGICDSRLLLDYWRTTLEGRIVFGKGLGHFAFAGQVGERFNGASPRAAEVEGAFRGIYPNLADVPIAASWTGPIDRTKDGLPFFGHLGGHPDIVYGLGFSGQGVGPTIVGGRILRALATGADDDFARCALVREPIVAFPPEPFRYVGALAVRTALKRKDGLEDTGRKAGPVTRYLASLAPTGYAATAKR